MLSQNFDCYNVTMVCIFFTSNIQCSATENRMTLILKKTCEMIFREKTKKSLPVPLLDIKRKNKLKLLGVTFNELSYNWDTHFDQMITKASSRLYFLRVCKFYECSSQELTNNKG